MSAQPLRFQKWQGELDLTFYICGRFCLNYFCKCLLFILNTKDKIASEITHMLGYDESVSPWMHFDS